MFLLYDPRTNLTQEVTRDYLIELTGYSKAKLYTFRSHRIMLRKIKCFLLPVGETHKSTVTLRKQWYSSMKYEEEHWVTVKGSNGDFLISNYGRFKRVYKTKEAFLLPSLRKANGSLYIKVRYQGIYQLYKIAQLVAFHFLDEVPDKVVRHKNGIKTDDYAGNLEYVSKLDLGKMTGYLSSSRPIVLLDPQTNEVIEEYRSAREAAKHVYINRQSICDYCNGKRKNLIGGQYKFMYLDVYEETFQNS